MKKILFLFAMMIAVGTANAAKLFAVFGTPDSQASYVTSTSVYSWTQSYSNLMECFTFGNGELAGYDQLVVTFSDYTNTVRVNVAYGTGSSDNVTVGQFYFAGTKTITTADIASKLPEGKTLADVTSIRFGGNSASGTCTIKAENVYLENKKFARYAEFQTPSSNGHYTAPTYTSTGSTSNLMTCFELSDGEISNYDQLVVSFNLVKGNARVGYYVGDTWTQLQAYYSAGVKFLFVDPSTLPSGVTKISFGGLTSDDEVTIVESNMLLTRERVLTDATLGTPASNASYAYPTYTWTASGNNLMDVYNFTNGELANFETLEVTSKNLVDGPWRMGYVVDSYTNFTGAPYYNNNTKNIVLAAEGVDMSTVTKIQLGGYSNSGSIDIKESDFILKTRQFTEDQKYTVCLPYALTEAEAAAAGKFYELTSADGTTLNFTEVKTTEANKPYVFIAAKEYPFAEVALTKTPVAGGAGSYTVGVYTFQGVSKKETVPSGVYGFNATNGAFSKTITDDVTINARRAYITVAGGVDAHELTINLGGDATGISTMKTQVKDNDNTIYNLNGQRVGADYKGIVIKNGKKFITK